MPAEYSRITESNFSCSRFQFYLAANLQINITYVLVVTTFDPNVQGEFSVIVNGPNNVDLNRTSKFFLLK